MGMEKEEGKEQEAEVREELRIKPEKKTRKNNDKGINYHAWPSGTEVEKKKKE